MKRRLFYFFQHFLLMALILTSFILSYLIWFSSNTNNLAPKNDENKELLVKNSVKDIFLPKMLIWHRQNSSVQLLGENILADLHTNFSEFNFEGNISDVFNTEVQAYLSKINGHETIEFEYQGEMNLVDYLEVYQLTSAENREKIRGFAFKSILVDFRNHEAQFINSKYTKAVRIGFKNSSTNTKKNIKDKGKLLTKIPVIFKKETLSYSYETTGSVKLKKYSYVVDAKSDSQFREIFFSDQSKVEIIDNDIFKRYSSSNGEIIEINSQNLEITYQIILGINKKLAKNLTKKSVNYLEKIVSQGIFQDLRYFEKLDNLVTYRNFIEGFPVFGKNYQGELTFSLNNDPERMSEFKIKTNKEILQIPVSTNEEIVLPTTEKVLQNLAGIGISATKIKEMSVGYGWKKIAETKNVIDLVPSWYVFYQNEWRCVEELISNRGRN